MIDRLRDEIADRNLSLLQLDRDKEDAFQQRQTQTQPPPPNILGQLPLPGTTHQMAGDGGIYNITKY